MGSVSPLSTTDWLRKREDGQSMAGEADLLMLAYYYITPFIVLNLASTKKFDAMAYFPGYGMWGDLSDEEKTKQVPTLRLTPDLAEKLIRKRGVKLFVMEHMHFSEWATFSPPEQRCENSKRCSLPCHD